MTVRVHAPTDAAVAANDQVRVNVECLMEMHRLTQVQLADRIGRSQSWLSKRLSGTTSFQIEDLDLIGDVFGLSPAQLLQPGHGKLDRRSGQDRRTRTDRRQLGERFQSPRGQHRIPHSRGDISPDDVVHDKTREKPT